MQYIFLIFYFLIFSINHYCTPHYTPLCRFHINLSCGAGPNGTVDTALHLNPRFEGDPSDYVVVRNSYLDGNWGAEERDGPEFPLKPGQEFECTILATDKHFKVCGHQKVFKNVKDYLG